MKEILGPLNDVIKNSKENIVNKSLKKLDVVSREEFEVQKKILLKTRQKLEQVEAKLDKLLAEKNNMSLAVLKSRAQLGIEAPLVCIEVHL